MVLVRPLIERAAIISYLDIHPEAIGFWHNGWKHGERPSLARMLRAMAGSQVVDNAFRVAQSDAAAHVGWEPEEISPAKLFPKIATASFLYLHEQEWERRWRRRHPRTHPRTRAEQST